MRTQVLHLLTMAAGAMHPAVWGASYASSAGSALRAANGNCGWGYAGNYIDPSSTACAGQYAYDDRTCDAECIVVEGIYWAIISHIGGLYTSSRARDIRNEWLMATPYVIHLPSLSPSLYTLPSLYPTIRRLFPRPTHARRRHMLMSLSCPIPR
jgi:hypothetical protein